MVRMLFKGKSYGPKTLEPPLTVGTYVIKPYIAFEVEEIDAVVLTENPAFVRFERKKNKVELLPEVITSPLVEIPEEETEMPYAKKMTYSKPMPKPKSKPVTKKAKPKAKK